MDHIAWALAQENVREEGITLTDAQERSVTFPLGDVPGAFSASPYMLPAASETIERFQPYNRTERPELEFLAILDDLSRTDKHRNIFDPRRRVSVFFGPGQPVTFVSINESTTQLFGGAKGWSEDFEPRVEFDEVLHPIVRGHRGFSPSELSGVHDLIRDEVIPAFAGFFEKANTAADGLGRQGPVAGHE